MAISGGTHLGTYELAEPLGVGGMGEVYRARDLKLKREVAIKVLPASFAADAERLARFQREAEILASLNHPNIAQIHGLESSGGITALVMELIEGPTLAERIEQGPIPVDDALTIALQIADALEAAHERGIVHRDLKPANIKLTHDGRVKVLDFGIAKAMDRPLNNSGPQAAMLTTPAMTEAGMILGTAAYMSPEQARGKAVDRRTDIWAFGCVLYEMLTGQPAFLAEDVPLTLARVLSQATNLKALPAATPPALRHTLELCLEKEQKNRIADMRDVRLALQGKLGMGSSAVAAGAARPPLWRVLLPLTAALVLGSVITGVALWQAPQATPTVNRFGYTIPAATAFRNTGRNVLAVSPTGRHFAYNTEQGIMLRDMSEVDARLIPGTEETLSNPFFAPDGRALAYYAFGIRQLKRIALDGGAPVTIATIGDNPNGASWAANGTIYYGQLDGIYRVAANGGTPELVIPSPPGEQLSTPELLPDGDTLLFATTTADWESADIVAQSLSTGERRVLVQGGNDPHYVPTGHLVYALGADLFAMAFDAETLTASGERVALVQGVAHAVITASSNYGIANDGTLVYWSGTAANQQRNLLWVGRDGVETAIPVAPGAYSTLQLAPDGRRVVVNEDPQDDNWIWDFSAETRTLLKLDEGGSDNPIWAADSTRLVYGSKATRAMEARAANNTGVPATLIDSSRMARLPNIAYDLPDPFFISGDGKQLVFGSYDATTLTDIGMLTIEGDSETTWLLRGRADERAAVLSPDGRWMAYESTESGQNEIYVRPFPNVDDDLVQVSNAGGRWPLWSRDGKELFYVTDDAPGARQLMTVAITTEGDKFSFGARTPLLAWPYAAPNSLRSYDVSADGQQFLVMRNNFETGVADAAGQTIIITQHWTEELKRLVPVKGR